MMRLLWFFTLLIFYYAQAQQTDVKKVKEVDVTLLGDISIQTGSVPIYNFDELEPLLHKYDGKTYIINFWATWCAPCVKELPHFEKLYKRYKKKGVEVILVSLDFPKMVEKQLMPFINNNNLKSKVVLLNDPKQNTWIPKVNSEWSGAIPATIIYKGNTRRFYEQTFTYKELKQELLRILNTKQ